MGIDNDTQSYVDCGVNSIAQLNNEARQTTQRLNALTVDKEQLQQRVELLTKELQISHDMFTTLADISEPVGSEMDGVFERIDALYKFMFNLAEEESYMQRRWLKL